MSNFPTVGGTFTVEINQEWIDSLPRVSLGPPSAPTATITAKGEHATDDDPFVDYEDDVPLARSNGFTRHGWYERSFAITAASVRNGNCEISGKRLTIPRQ